MAHSGGENAMMETPMMFMVAPKGKPMLPVTAVDAEKLKGWATETDTVPGQGISSDTGTWALYLGAYKSEATATRLVNLLSDAGYAAEITVRRAQGKTWQVVRLTGFDTENDAAAFVGPMIVLFPELHPRMAPM